MKHPLETLTTAAGILLMAFLSCLLLPAPALGLTLAQKLVWRGRGSLNLLASFNLAERRSGRLHGLGLVIV